MQGDVTGLAGLARGCTDVQTTLTQVHIAESKPAELAAADPADEQGHDDGPVALTGLAVASGGHKAEELVVGERAAWLVLDARCADVLQHARAAVLEDPALREERRERAERLPGGVGRLCGDRCASMVEIRVHRAGFDVLDARGAAELCRDPAVIQPELQPVVVLRRWG